MNKIAIMIYIIAAPTIAGMALTAALTVGADTGNPIIISVVAGALLAIPVAWYVAKKLKAIDGLTE